MRSGICMENAAVGATFLDAVRRAASLGILLLPLLVTGCPGPEPEPSGLSPGRWQTAVEADASVGALLSVWGPDPHDVWAVGGQVASIMDPGVGAAYRRLDGEWSPVELPADVPLLNWVHGTDSRVWIVGNGGAALYHDGDAFVTTDTGTEVPLLGCWASGDDDVWAVGGDAFDADGAPVILRWDGSAWTPQALPPLDRETNAMFKVWAAASDAVWVVGANGIILHFDGQAWTQQLAGTGNDLISLWGTGPAELVAVGGRSIGTIARFDGTSWSSENIGSVAGLNGIWMHPDGDAALAGNLGVAAILRPPAFDVELEDSGAGFLVLHGIFGFESGERIAVGGSLDRSPPYVGIIVETP